MPDIPFTQFVRPDGKRRATVIDMPAEVELLARCFIEAGGSYTSELVYAGVVSFCAEFTLEGERQDVVSVVGPNGPGVEEAVERLVRESYEFLQRYEAGQ